MLKLDGRGAIGFVGSTTCVEQRRIVEPSARSSVLTAGAPHKPHDETVYPRMAALTHLAGLCSRLNDSRLEAMHGALTHTALDAYLTLPATPYVPCCGLEAPT